MSALLNRDVTDIALGYYEVEDKVYFLKRTKKRPWKRWSVFLVKVKGKFDLEKL